MPIPREETNAVQTWLKTAGSLLDVIQASKPGPDSLLAEVGSILEAMQTSNSDPESVSRRAEAIVRRVQAPLLRGLFLARWAYFSADVGRLAESEHLHQRALEILPRDAPFEFRWQIDLAQVNLLYWKGDLLGHRELCRKLASQYPRNSPRRLRSLFALASDLAEYGRLSEIPDWPTAEERPEGLFLEDQYFVTQTNFADRVQTGALEQAETLVTQVSEGLPRFSPSRRILIQYHLDLLKLQQGRWSLPPLSTNREDALLHGLLTVLYHLTQGKPQEALAQARTLEIDSQDVIWVQYGLTTLLRAELSCGNHLAAKRLLDKEQARSGEHYLDELFLARIERLSGHSEQAAEHFARLRDRIAFYKAEGRLDFELKMACELTPGDLFRWMNAKPSKPKAPEAPSPALQPSEGLGRLLGSSPALKTLRKLIRDMALHDAPVLITGETGTGKDLAARAIHHESPRKKEPFVAVNCSGITESLLASELFGHVKGAFTGAERDRPGLFEQAGKGTIFLDEIGDISPGLQLALLRVLDQGEIRPVGSDKDRKIRCRIITATNAALEERVRAGNFREDLLFRLQRLTLHIPPLRERPEDLRDLTSHFLNEGRPEGMHAACSPGLMGLFERHAWAGNVRELKNAIERLRVLNSDGLHYGIENLDPTLDQRLRGDPAHATGARTEDAPPTADRDAERARTLLRAGHTPLRRQARLKALFLEHRSLTRAEVSEITGVSLVMAAKDIKTLCAQGLIRKQKGSHYYTVVEVGGIAPPS